MLDLSGVSPPPPPHPHVYEIFNKKKEKSVETQGIKLFLKSQRYRCGNRYSGQTSAHQPYRAEGNACALKGGAKLTLNQPAPRPDRLLLFQYNALCKLSKWTRLSTVDIMLYGQSSTGLAWVSLHSAAVLQSCASLPGACLKKSSCKEHGDPRAIQSILFPQESLPEFLSFSIWEESSL